MSDAQLSDPCECAAAGFCARFRRKVSVAQHDACQTNAGGYRDHHTALAAGLPSPLPVPAAAATPPPEPGLWRKAVNFAAAALKQAPLFVEAAVTRDESKAFRSAGEIERIAEICKACPLFNGEVCTHKNCGCTISADRSAWLSKLAWRSTKCPDDPPKWGEEENKQPAPEAPAEIPPPWPPADEWLVSIPPGCGIPEGSYPLRLVEGAAGDETVELACPLADCPGYDRFVLRLSRFGSFERADAFLACSLTPGYVLPEWSTPDLPRGLLAKGVTLHSHTAPGAVIHAMPVSAEKTSP